MPKANTQTINYSNNLHARFPEDLRFDGARFPGGVAYASGQILGEVNTVRRNDAQTITIGATGGTYKLGLDDYTAAIAYNATNSQIQAALEAVPTIGSGNVAVTLTGPFLITFQNEMGNRPLPTLLIDNGSATGGSVTVAHTTLGSIGPSGLFAAWDSTRSDGAEIAKAINWNTVRTNAKGELVGEWGAVSANLTGQIVYNGEFPADKLTGLNSITLAQLGKIIKGGYDYTAGVNEIQRIDLDIASSGGSLRLIVSKPDGSRVTTASITWDTTDATYLAAINSALDTATGVTAGIVATAISAVDPNLGFLLTYSGTGYANRSWPLPQVFLFPTSSTKANYSRSTLGYAGFAAGTIVKIGV